MTTTKAEHWSYAPTRARWAFRIGGGIGALWPFELFTIAWLCRTGANPMVDGPGNWADEILGWYMAASFAGCFVLLVLPVVMGFSFFVCGYVSAIAATRVRRIWLGA